MFTCASGALSGRLRAPLQHSSARGRGGVTALTFPLLLGVTFLACGALPASIEKHGWADRRRCPQQRALRAYTRRQNACGRTGSGAGGHGRYGRALYIIEFALQSAISQTGHAGVRIRARYFLRYLSCSPYGDGYGRLSWISSERTGRGFLSSPLAGEAKTLRK